MFYFVLYCFIDGISPVINISKLLSPEEGQGVGGHKIIWYREDRLKTYSVKVKKCIFWKYRLHYCHFSWKRTRVISGRNEIICVLYLISYLIDLIFSYETIHFVTHWLKFYALLNIEIWFIGNKFGNLNIHS